MSYSPSRVRHMPARALHSAGRLTGVALLAVAGLGLAGQALAGRPLSTDDPNTADTGTCQVELWTERSRGRADGSTVLAPACGLAPGLELGVEHRWARPGQDLRASAGLGLKWGPDFAQRKTALGPLALGLKLALGYDRPAAAGWRHNGLGLLALAVLQPTEQLQLLANLGPVRDAASGSATTQMNLALAWTPLPAALLFAETQANDRPASAGATVNTLGGRWWLLPEHLGLDLSASRAAGSGLGTRWSLGLGWYGIGR